MRIAVGADHAGFDLKEGLKTLVSDLGHAVVDCGTHSTGPVDYPDIAVKVAEAVTAETVDRGILTAEVASECASLQTSSRAFVLGSVMTPTRPVRESSTTT